MKKPKRKKLLTTRLSSLLFFNELYFSRFHRKSNYFSNITATFPQQNQQYFKIIVEICFFCAIRRDRFNIEEISDESDKYFDFGF